MTLRRCTVIAVGLALLWSAAVAAAEEGEIGFTAAADYYTKYIWRGQNLNDESVVQPSVSVSAYGFTAVIWGSFDLTNQNDIGGNFAEIDWSLDYTAAIPDCEWLSITVGAIYYELLHTAVKSTTEVYGGLSIDTILSPSVKIYRDIDEIDGSYIQLGIGHAFEKVTQWKDDCYCGIALGASTGYGSSSYNSGYFGVSGGRLNDVTLTAGIPTCIGAWTIRPSISYAWMISDAIRAATLKSDNIWGGVTAAYSF